MDDFQFYVLSTVFQSHQDNGWVIMKGFVQWNPCLRLKRPLPQAGLEVRTTSSAIWCWCKLLSRFGVKLYFATPADKREIAFHGILFLKGDNFYDLPASLDKIFPKGVYFQKTLLIQEQILSRVNPI